MLAYSRCQNTRTFFARHEEGIWSNANELHDCHIPWHANAIFFVHRCRARFMALTSTCRCLSMNHLHTAMARAIMDLSLIPILAFKQLSTRMSAINFAFCPTHPFAWERHLQTNCVHAMTGKRTSSDLRATPSPFVRLPADRLKILAGELTRSYQVQHRKSKWVGDLTDKFALRELPRRLSYTAHVPYADLVEH